MTNRAPSLRLAALALMLLATAGCGARGPQPIDYGNENCERCRMTISQPRFAGELLMTTGKALKFDSIECLATYYKENTAGEGVHSLWVTDYLKPGEFIRADSAIYVAGGNVPSPMGMSLLAFAPGADTASLVRQFGGKVAGWKDVLAIAGARADVHDGGHR